MKIILVLSLAIALAGCDDTDHSDQASIRDTTTKSDNQVVTPPSVVIKPAVVNEEKKQDKADRAPQHKDQTKSMSYSYCLFVAGTANDTVKITPQIMHQCLDAVGKIIPKDPTTGEPGYFGSFNDFNYCIYAATWNDTELTTEAINTCVETTNKINE